MQLNPGKLLRDTIQPYLMVDYPFINFYDRKLT